MSVDDKESGMRLGKPGCVDKRSLLCAWQATGALLIEGVNKTDISKTCNAFVERLLSGHSIMQNALIMLIIDTNRFLLI